MKTYIYRGGFPIVEKSGVGKAIEHQEKMLNAVQAPRAARWKEATVVHMNTVFPDSVIAAFIAKIQKKKVIYMGILQWRILKIPLLVLILQRRFLKNGSAFVIIWGMLL